MEQFRQIGEVLGSLKAMMVFRGSIQVNQRQCCLLLDMFVAAYDSIAEKMMCNLKFEEKHTKWRVLEQPLRELHRTFKGGQHYIRQSLENKDWWAKAILLYQNTDCIEFYIHNLLCCVYVVVEAIEIAAAMSGSDLDEAQKKKRLLSKKYLKEWRDPRIFQWRFGKEYLVSQDFCCQLDGVWKEDRWLLQNKIRERKVSGSETRLTDLLLANLDESGMLNGRLLPSSVLVGSKDYQVRRRLGNGSQYKEILWLGESFALRHFFGEIEALVPEISSLLSLSHPNILHYLCGFMDNERKECYLVMELMSRDLCSHIKEIRGPRRRIPFSLPVAVDLMLQIARGMEYLHSRKIYHGELNPSKILIKARTSVSSDGYSHAKISGFGLSSVKSTFQKSSENQNDNNLYIWYAPEVLAEQEQLENFQFAKHTEKSDVYSFGMICFEILTGKVPFEDEHLQGNKMSRNIRAGERPLFPFYAPKCVTNLTKKCWHPDPNQRPSFPSICRILRYIKRFLVMNPDYSQRESPRLLLEYCDVEARLLREFPHWKNPDLLPISEIPFQMFAYRVEEKGRVTMNQGSESGSDAGSTCGDDNVTAMDDPFIVATEKKSLFSPVIMDKKMSSVKRSTDMKAKNQGTPKGQSNRPPRMRNIRMNSESQLMEMSLKARKSSGHASDSELP